MCSPKCIRYGRLVRRTPNGYALTSGYRSLGPQGSDERGLKLNPRCHVSGMAEVDPASRARAMLQLVDVVIIRILSRDWEPEERACESAGQSRTSPLQVDMGRTRGCKMFQL